MKKNYEKDLFTNEISLLEINITSIESIIKYLENGFNEHFNYIHSDIINLINIINCLTKDSKNEIETIDSYMKI